MSKLLNKWNRIKFILGKDIPKHISKAGSAGAFMFFVDIAFVVVIQGFLFSIELVDNSKLNLPIWYPTDFLSTISLLLCFGFVRSLALILKLFLAGQTSQEFLYKTRSELLRHGLFLGSEVSTHELVSVFTESVNRASQAVYLFINVIINLFSILFLICYGLFLSPYEMLVGIVCLVLLVLPLTFMNKEVGSMGRGLNVEWKNTSKNLIEGIKLNFYLKVYNLLGKTYDEGDASLNKYRKHYIEFHFKNAIRHGLPPFLGICILTVITYLGIHIFNTPSIVLLTFFYLFIRLGQLLSEFATYMGSMQLNLEGMKDLEVWLKKYRFIENKMSSNEIRNTKRSLDLTDITIAVDNLGFKYDAGPFLFEKLSFQLNKGDCLVIKGESGVGKSSLLALLLGILKPSHGSVAYNSMLISDIRADIVDHIGYIGPDPYLVAGTLRDNLLLGHPQIHKVTEEQIESSIKFAELTEVVGSYSKGVEMHMDESVKLSTGQKQRVAIARALLRNPKILVLDEATANLDDNTEKAIVNNLKKLKESMVMIIISHKASFDTLATQLIHLQRF